MAKMKSGVRSPTAHRTLEQAREHYRDYQGKPSQIKKRAQRNAARRKLEKQGRVREGDGKDVEHERPIRHGGSNAMSNLSVLSRKTNRGWNKKK